MSKAEKTNVGRLLEAKKIPYEMFNYEKTGCTNGVEIAKIMGKNPETVFKTLVTAAKSGGHYVFVIPVEAELDLKKAAVAVKEKSISMIPQKELLPLTGYVHGGCSPIGMKKFFPTTFHITAQDFESIYFSGGKIGFQVNVKVNDLPKIIDINFADIIV